MDVIPYYLKVGTLIPNVACNHIFVSFDARWNRCFKVRIDEVYRPMAWLAYRFLVENSSPEMLETAFCLEFMQERMLDFKYERKEGSICFIRNTKL